MNYQSHTAFVHLGALSTLALTMCFVAPSFAHAAGKPAISFIEPDKGDSYDRTEEMPVVWKLKNITRDMVVVTKITLVKRDTSGPSVGYVSGSGWQHTIHTGTTTGGFIEDFGLNDTVPGKYSIVSELHECGANCDTSLPGKRIAKSKKITFYVTNEDGWSSTASGTGVTVEILSPNGDEKYVAGSEKNLKIKWKTEGAPDGSRACITLEKKGGNGGFFAFPGNSPGCKKIKDGKGSVTGKLIQNAGYDLGPGEYWARVNIIAKATGGKDGATLAEDISDDTFTLR